jgi:hypothetical protein
MAEELRFTEYPNHFIHGHAYRNLTVLDIKGPNGSRACAYCTPMNIDLDGEPQAYAPQGRADLRPIDYIGNAGWRDRRNNAADHAEYEEAKRMVAALELAASAPPPANAPPPSPAAKEQQKKILEFYRAKVKRLGFSHLNANGNQSPNNPKNFEVLHWKWYGVYALTPQEARAAKPFRELFTNGEILRKPVIDTTAIYEDVFGRFPVVQSLFEPGPGYFVTTLPGSPNNWFPIWDQRFYYPLGAADPSMGQGPYAALSTGLYRTAGLRLADRVFAIRLDTSNTADFPFRDAGYGDKLGECSMGAFIDVGGNYYPQFLGAAKFPNTFNLVYLAFPDRQTPQSVIGKFQTASNASDLVAALSFLARSTANAAFPSKKDPDQSRIATDYPLSDFLAWKKASTKLPLQYDAVLTSGLARAGGGDFVRRMIERHPKLTDGGPFLKLDPR